MGIEQGMTDNQAIAGKAVLILVLMEWGLSAQARGPRHGVLLVLILVLMEWGLSRERGRVQVLRK